MRLLKLALISFIVLFAIVTGISLFIPSHVLVSRAVNISAPPDSIVSNISNLNRWKTWAAGMTDSSVHILSPGEARMAAATLKIGEVTPSLVTAQWKSQRGDSLIAEFHLVSDSLHHVVVVQWIFRQDLAWYPWVKLGSLMNEKVLGGMMEKNLGQLKTQL